MPRGVKKENLPSKVCVVCNRPFTWRKKWESCWDEVTTCSKSCNSSRRSLKSASNKSERSGAAAESADQGMCSDESGDAPTGEDDIDARTARKDSKKAAKAEKRAKREGRAPATTGQKLCDVCASGVDLLVRCRIDATRDWKLVCGKCWKDVSGGIADGDAAHPHYRYGGLWKNRAFKISASSSVTIQIDSEETAIVNDLHELSV